MSRHPSRSIRHRICLMICAALLGACGSSSAQSGSSPQSGSTTASTSTPSTVASTPANTGGASICGPAGAQTVAAGGRARVYATGGEVFGCARGGTSYVLGRSMSCIQGALAGPFAVSGVRVALALKRCGVDTGRSEVLVRRLDTGRVVAEQPATTTPLGAESYVTVTAIVLARDGAFAWITEAASIVSHRRAIEVHASGRQATRILDSGAGIGARSLRLSGNRVSWRSSGRVRSARLG